MEQPTEDLLAAAIFTICNPTSSTADQNGTNGSVREASAWLEHFGHTDEAWSACCRVISQAGDAAPDGNEGSHDNNNGAHPGKFKSRSDVQYFCANMLLSKVRRELDSEREVHWRDQTSGALYEKLGSVFMPRIELVNWQLVLKRICLVLGGIAARSDRPRMEKFFGNALSLATSGLASGDTPATNSAAVRTSMYLLTSFAEEAKSLDRTRLCRIGIVSGPLMVNILRFLEAVLSSTPSSNSSQSLSATRLETMQCLTAWLEIKSDSMEEGALAVTLADVLKLAPNLLVHMLDLLKDEDEDVICQTCDALEVLMQNAIENFMSSEPINPELHRAVFSIGNMIVFQQGRISSCTDRVIVGLLRVAQAIAEADSGVVAGAIPGSENIALGMAKFVLECAALDDQPHSIMESAAEYFMLLNMVPMSDRHEQLREPLYNEVLLVCLKRVQFPQEYDSLEDLDPEEYDSFTKFREQTMCDILGQTYGILRLHYIRVCGEAITNNSCWQVAEAGMFALRSAAQNIKLRLFGERLGDLKQSVSTSSLQRERNETSSLLAQIFQVIVVGEIQSNSSGRILTCNELSINYCTMVIGAYAFWFQQHIGSPIEDALIFCVRALLVRRAVSQAAIAFKALCIKCSAVLTSKEDIRHIENLVENSEKVLNQMMVAPRSEPDISDEKALIEGLAIIISKVKNGERCIGLARKLCYPLMYYLQQVAQQVNQLSNQPAANLHQLGVTTTSTLYLFAAAMRFLDISHALRNISTETKRAIGNVDPIISMISDVWPALTAISSDINMRTMPFVFKALCEFFSCAIKTTAEASCALLPVLVEMLIPICESHAYPCILETFAIAAEILGKIGNPDVDKALQRAASSASSSALALLHKTGIPENPELTQALLEMVHRFALFAPTTILTSPVIKVVVQMSVVAGGCREAEVARSSYFFLSLLLAPGEKTLRDEVWKDNYPEIRKLLSSESVSLVRMTLCSLAETAARQLHRQLSGILYCLIQLLGEEDFLKIASHFLSQPEFPGTNTGHLTSDTSRMFLELVTKKPSIQRLRFDALVADFAKICRGESTSDVLIAYAM